MSGGRLLTRVRRALGWIANDDDMVRDSDREQAELDLREATGPRPSAGGATDGDHDDD